MDILEEPFSIRFADIDESDTLTIASTCDFFQEAAINHAEFLGVGRDAMRKAGQVWILSRFSVFMERRPRYTEKVSIRSWPRGANKLFAVRDYDIRDESGRAVVRGRGGWLILDWEKRRPLRPQAVVENLPPNEGIDALPGAAPGNDVPPALSAREFSAPPVQRRAAYSDIDFNGHMNNTRYIQWIQDLMEPCFFTDAGQIRLDINYLAEVRYGETVSLYMLPLEAPEFPAGCAAANPAPCKAAFAIEGRRETENGEPVPVFRAELRAG